MIFINTEGKAAAENVGEISEETTRKSRECGVLALIYLMVGGQRIRRKGQGDSRKPAGKILHQKSTATLSNFLKGPTV